MSILSKGIIDRAFDAGTENPSLYLKRYPAAIRPPKGGYEIQCTPQELAAVISQVRSYMTGKRMLCLGTETLGAERFMAENMGITELDYIGSALATNVIGLSNSNVTLKQVKEPTGTYDVITVFGHVKITLHQLMDFAKIGTHVICIGVATAAKNAELRSLWMGMRRKYMTMLQTGARDYETGTGVVKVLYVKTPAIPSIPSPVVVEDEEESEPFPNVLSNGGQWTDEEKAVMEAQQAPYGRKADGTPKKRPGRQAVAA